ncbi:hypothetical protein F4775DRAFT_467108 [Biscogniauxia sp. FL1348]|nr:hypothetical protein F4775DRAFT_82950 [Biscogniauxia sp. FL1348]KAI0593946.1 hypothetical protein F4775DRAFT_467108 [Biscogniauxia sp. FL1348]
MITVISDKVLDAARELNRRDIQRLEAQLETEAEQQAPAATADNEDDQIWAKYEGIEGLKGAAGQPIKVGGSYYSYGPYPRNRRVLADIALAAGWTVEKARILERRCITKMARHLKDVEKGSPMVDLSDPNQPRMSNGRPFTFQHISWSFLPGYVRAELREMDPDKMAVIKAAVLDLYETNSKTGRKVLPPCPGGRRSDALPVGEAEIARAQEELDRAERYSRALHLRYEEKWRYLSPDEVKRQIKARIGSGDVSEEDFCRTIDVTPEELAAFMAERKLRPQHESKVFHNALEHLKPHRQGRRA